MFLLFDGKIGDQVTFKKKRYSIGTLRDILSAPQVLAAGCVDKTVRCLLKKGTSLPIITCKKGSTLNPRRRVFERFNDTRNLGLL